MQECRLSRVGVRMGRRRRLLDPTQKVYTFTADCREIELHARNSTCCSSVRAAHRRCTLEHEAYSIRRYAILSYSVSLSTMTECGRVRFRPRIEYLLTQAD
eukprot:6110282-Pleurochrysis_carterae.AAC.1